MKKRTPANEPPIKKRASSFAWPTEDRFSPRPITRVWKGGRRKFMGTINQLLLLVGSFPIPLATPRGKKMRVAVVSSGHYDERRWFGLVVIIILAILVK